jgi:hypothetical protein
LKADAKTSRVTHSTAPTEDNRINAECTGREYNYIRDIHRTVENENSSTVPTPKDIEAAASATKRRIWERPIDEYVKHGNNKTENCETVYSLVMGQCPEYTRSKLEWLNEYNTITHSFNIINLIKATKGLTYQFEGQKYHNMVLHLAKQRVYGLYQGRDSTNPQYPEKSQTCVSIVEQYGGNIGQDTGVAKAEMEAMGVKDFAAVPSDENLEATQVEKDKYLAVAFISSADKLRFGTLLEDLENYYTKWAKNYPVSIISAYKLIVHYKKYQKPVGCLYNDSEGVSFVNIEKKGT